MAPLVVCWRAGSGTPGAPAAVLGLGRWLGEAAAVLAAGVVVRVDVLGLAAEVCADPVAELLHPARASAARTARGAA